MSSKTDITTELRDWAASICSIRGDATPGRKSQMVRDAADEIDRLRAEVNDLFAAIAALKAELAQRTAERDALAAEVAALKAEREVPTSITRCMVRLDGVWITPDAALDEIHRLRAEVAALKAQRDEAFKHAINAALKANDPLAEMWAALAEYQPQADRDGHGESWRRMCEERTGESAWEAMREARNAARDAARDAAKAAAQALADATEWAVNAIDAIRRAKGVQP